MLVLTRKIGQSIQIGNDVRVTVVRIQGSTARIAIEAPGDLPVRREELTLRLEAKQPIHGLQGHD